MALKLALDTNRYSDLCRGETDTVALVETAEAVFLPFIVLAELRAGFAAGTKGRENEGILQRFLAKPGVEVLWPSEATTQVYASLYRQLRQQASPIPTNDLWIAALVLEHGIALGSRDRHFLNLPQLDLL